MEDPSLGTTSIHTLSAPGVTHGSDISPVRSDRSSLRLSPSSASKGLQVGHSSNDKLTAVNNQTGVNREEGRNKLHGPESMLLKKYG